MHVSVCLLTEAAAAARAAGESGELDEYRYPRPGSRNAQCTLRLVTFTLRDQEITCVTHARLRQELAVSCPWFDYMPRAGTGMVYIAIP